MVLNAQALINISQVRLCGKADEITREIWQQVTWKIRASDNPYIKAIGTVMMPRCAYRGGICHELKSCNRNPRYLEGAK